MVNIFNFFLIVTLTFLPAIIWLLFFLKGDSKPEPRKAILLAFFWGFIVTIPTFLIEIIFQKLGLLYSILSFVLLIAIIEEFMKFFVARTIAKKNKNFDEPVDAMIYMIVVSLGFASMENLLIILGEIIPFSFSGFFELLNTIALRFIGATLLHALASAVFGYYWALSHFQGKKIALLRGACLAIVIHAIFNYLTLSSSNPSFYSIFFLVFIAFFVLSDFKKIEKEKI